MGIGPDCLHGKITLMWINHDLEVDVASIAFGIGMPEDFVTATLAAPRPLYREPLDHFPTASSRTAGAWSIAATVRA